MKKHIVKIVIAIGLVVLFFSLLVNIADLYQEIYATERTIQEYTSQLEREEDRINRSSSEPGGNKAAVASCLGGTK